MSVTVIHPNGDEYQVKDATTWQECADGSLEVLSPDDQVSGAALTLAPGHWASAYDPAQVVRIQATRP